jgi:hypothetical protein
MTDLKRYTATDPGKLSRWVVTGPDGALVLETAAGLFAGVFTHSRTNRYSEQGEPCNILDATCWSDAMSNKVGREVFALLPDDDAVYGRLEELYLKQWPGGGRCGESVPQANYDTPKAGA